MKKAIFYALLLLNLVVFLAFSNAVNGQGSLKDLGIKSTGLLPSNPFYFVKEWTRTVKQAFTFDIAKKHELNLSIVNEKAAELSKLADVAPNKTEAIVNAVINYEYALDQLISGLNLAKDNSLISNKFLDRLLDLSLKHAELLEALSNQFVENTELVERLKGVNAKVTGLISLIPQKLESIDSFKVRFQQILNDQKYDLKELKAAEVLDRLEDALPEGQLRLEINFLKKDLLLRFSVKLQQGLETDNFDQLAIDPIVRLKTLDEIRRSIEDQELKNQLNILRQKFLDHIIQEGRIGKAEARSSIDKANQSLNLLMGKVKSSPMLDQAKFYFTQANKFFEEENFSGAFSQSVLVIGIMDDVMRQIAGAGKINNSQDDLMTVKKEFDRLMNLAKSNQLNPYNAVELFELFNKTEKLIVDASDAKVINLEQIKIILANIDVILKR